MSNLPVRPIDQPISPDAVAAMQLVSGPVSWVEQVTDRLNPIFVKETRQALKSKQFAIMFMARVGVGWLISAFGITGTYRTIEAGGSVGAGFFTAYYIVLCQAILALVPFGAFRSLVTERNDETYEPLSITTLSPRQIVTGKLLSAMLQTFLFYSAIAPFIAFTSLLQGFDVTYAIFMLIGGLVGSLALTTAALAASSGVKGRIHQIAMSLMVLFLLEMVFIIAWTIAVDNWWERARTDGEFWVVMTILLLAVLSYSILLKLVAVTNLKFEMENRSTPLRMFAIGQYLLFLVGLAIFAWYSATIGGRGYPDLDEVLYTMLSITAVHWFAFGLFFITEPDELSMRVRNSLPTSPLLRGLLAPLYPGGSRGLSLVLLLTGLQWIACLLLSYSISNPGAQIEFRRAMLLGMLYFLCYILVLSAVSRVLYAAWPTVKPSAMRVICLFVVALLNLLPALILVYRQTSYGYAYSVRDFSWLYLTSPFIVADAVSLQSDMAIQVSLALAAIAGLLLLVNLWPMGRAWIDIVSSSRTHRSGRRRAAT